jgi:ribosome-associated protein
MDQQLSKSEKKRRAKSIEQMVLELASLSDGELHILPCNNEIQKEIVKIKKLKSGARKRQIKYITKLLRNEAPDDLFRFLEEKKGSVLKKEREFHELEQLRDELINEAMQFYDDLINEQEADVSGRLDENWKSEAVHLIKNRFPEIEVNILKKSALQFARTHNKRYSRELFKVMKAASERAQFAKE